MKKKVTKKKTTKKADTKKMFNVASVIPFIKIQEALQSIEHDLHQLFRTFKAMGMVVKDVSEPKTKKKAKK